MRGVDPGAPVRFPIIELDSCPVRAHTRDVTTTETFEIRQSNTGNAHVGIDGVPVCGAAKTWTVRRAASLEQAERYVTCSKCRKAQGWTTIAGSYASRTTHGLDSSAWGANKGR